MFENIEAKALENVRSAILVTDATAPDMPIIYVNPAFQTLTGYEFDEIAGRNCRFLQGEDNDQPGLKTVREMIARQKSVHAVLKNYRKDGEPFFNELFIDPIFDSGGKVTHFVGCQNECANSLSANLLEPGHVRYKRLTGREKQVFELLASGYSNKSIARKLAISPRTAEKHRLSVYSKFEVSNLALLLRFAIALGVYLETPDG